MTAYTNKADFGGSFMYNLSKISGFSLSPNTDDDAHMYSDLYAPGNNVYNDYITNISDDDFDQANGVTGGNSTYRDTLTQEQYEAGDWFVAGKTFLPWFAPASDGQGGYYSRHDWHNDIYFNKARKEILIPTITTAIKIGGSIFIVYLIGSKVLEKVFQKIIKL